MQTRTPFLPVLLLGTLLACGGGSSSPSGPAAASRLTYGNPTAGSYQLRQNASLSTSSHLVLELWGPSGTSGSGVTVAFTLSGTGAVWSNVKTADAAGTYVASGGTFDLGAGTPILKATVTGATLIATITEKGTATPKALDKPLLQLALDLQPKAVTGAVATLTPDPARCKVLLPGGTLSPIAITASTITAQ